MFYAGMSNHVADISFCRVVVVFDDARIAENHRVGWHITIYISVWCD